MSEKQPEKWTSVRVRVTGHPFLVERAERVIAAALAAEGFRDRPPPSLTLVASAGDDEEVER
jgi:hypothetical protein